MSTKLIPVKRVKNAVLYQGDPAKGIPMRVEKVIASYPHVGEKWAGQDGDKPAYSVTGLLDKETHAEAIDLISTQIEAMITAKNASGKGFRVPPSKRCLKDGDNEEFHKPETTGRFLLATREPKNLPTLKAMRGGKPVNISPEEAESMFYGGCVCTILFRLWPQDNEYGKRINAGLLGVVFVADGGAFGEGRVDDTDAYDDLDDEDGGWSEEPDDDL